MAVTRDMLLSELKDLLRLTAFEQTVATVRRAQARTSPIERELAENARKAGERVSLLRSAVAQVGGTPDVVGPVLGRAGAVVQTQVNQVQTLQGALLGDLALEHQLRERTRYARVLAQSLGETSVLPVLDRLEVAHSATIEWLETRLREVGRTGTSALKATPVQLAVTTVRRAAGTPLGFLSAGVNRTGGLLGKVTGRAPQSLHDALQQVEDAARGAADTVIDLTRSAGDKAQTAAESAEDVVEPVDDSKPPFAGYSALPGDTVMRHVEDSEDVDELRTLLAFEQAHKARKGVVQAAQQRLSTLTSS